MGAGGGFEKLLDVEDGAQQDRIVGGSALIAERMAEALGGRVRTGFAATHVWWGEDGVEIAMSGETVRARTAVIAVPPALVGAITFEPGLPESHAALAEAWKGGDLIKLTATYADLSGATMTSAVKVSAPRAR